MSARPNAKLAHLRTMDRSYTRLRARAIRSADDIRRCRARPCRAEHLRRHSPGGRLPKTWGCPPGRLRRIHEAMQRHIEPPGISESVMRVACRTPKTGPYESLQILAVTARQTSQRRNAGIGANQHRRTHSVVVPGLGRYPALSIALAKAESPPPSGARPLAPRNPEGGWFGTDFATTEAGTRLLRSSRPASARFGTPPRPFQTSPRRCRSRPAQHP